MLKKLWIYAGLSPIQGLTNDTNKTEFKSRVPVPFKKNIFFKIYDLIKKKL